MSIFKNSYIYVCMSEVHHNVNTGYLWVGQLFSNSQKRQLLLVYFFLCSVLFISLWFLNTKGIYVKGYIYIVFFYVDHLLKVLTECVTILLLLFMFWFFGHEACEILAPQPGFKPYTPDIGKWSLNHWTASEVSTWKKKFFLKPCHVGCRISLIVPWLGTEPMLPSVEAQSLDHWIAREVPRIYTLKNKSKQTKNKPHQFPGRRYTLKAEVENWQHIGLTPYTNMLCLILPIIS